MEKTNFDYNKFAQTSQPEQASLAKTFMANVFSWMFLALAVTGLTAYAFSHNEQLAQYLFNEITGPTPLFYIAIFSPIVFVFVISLGLERFSLPVLIGLFLAYSFMMGMSLFFIFSIYTEAHIVQTFFITAGAFAGMAVLGYTTKTDLTKLASILYMALFGVIIASIVTMFTGGSTFIIDLICVVIFTGLTAYKVQWLKNLSAQASLDTVQGKKMALWGALTLYITFINLFLTLLRLFGSKR